MEHSTQQPVVIFKHSTRCPVSSMALRMLERDWDISESEVAPYFLDLIRYREISNQITDELGVRHESPQLILIKDKQAVYDASHQMISANLLKEAL